MPILGAIVFCLAHARIRRNLGGMPSIEVCSLTGQEGTVEAP